MFHVLTLFILKNNLKIIIPDLRIGSDYIIPNIEMYSSSYEIHQMLLFYKKMTLKKNLGLLQPCKTKRAQAQIRVDLGK